MTGEARRSGFDLIKLAMAVVMVFSVAMTSLPQRAEASLLGGAFGGGLIGGIIGGGGGMVAGALIGGTVGAISEGNRRARYRSGARYKAHSNYARRTTASAPRVASSASYTLVVETQKALVSHGFDPGKIDGVAGSGTRNAIEAYQKKNSLLVTGTSSDALLKHMLQNKG
jgi:hypothetical protein